MSYVNMILYGAVLPSYNNKKDNKGVEKQDVIKVDDPRNRKRVKEIFEQFE